VSAIGFLLSRAISQVLPPLCPGCGREGELLCERCGAPLRARLDEPPGQPLGVPAALPAALLQLEWCAPFSGAIRASLHALKYDGARDLAGPLGAAIAARWRVAGRGGEALVPVPVHAARLRDRGYDQAALLANEAGRSLGLPVVPALARTSATVAMHALGRTARARNVGHGFHVRAPYRGRLNGRWLVLVDDVVTTGATLSACAETLLEAGAAAVSALTVAREG
jgi:ComF family protein